MQWDECLPSWVRLQKLFLSVAGLATRDERAEKDR